MCAIIGMVSVNDEVIGPLKRAAFKHQHRSHRSAGAVTYDDKQKTYYLHRGIGRFTEIFSEEATSGLKGKIGIQHLRWATHGELTPDNVHPLRGVFRGRPFYVAHNGEISFRRELERQFSGFQPNVTADTKFIIGLIETSGASSFVEALQYAFGIVKGTYSLLILYENTLYAVRDITGNRPLFLGRAEKNAYVASESFSLAVLGVPLQNIREIIPGEMLIVHGNGLAIESKRILAPVGIVPMLKFCMIELLYSMHPATVIMGRTVSKIREQMGIALALRFRPDADIVVGVPDSGIFAGRGFARGIGLPYVEGILRYHQSGRIFYYGMGEREDNYRLKYDAVVEDVCGKRVILVDDTMFAGDTIKNVVNVCLQAGAKKFHIAVPSPMIVSPCFYGTPTSSDHRRLIAADYRANANDMLAELNASCSGRVKSIGFLSLQEAAQAAAATKPFLPGYDWVSEKNFCNACFLGGARHIPVDVA